MREHHMEQGRGAKEHKPTTRTQEGDGDHTGQTGALVNSGYVLMAMAALALSLMGALTKWTSQTIPSIEIVFFRGVLMSLGIIIYARTRPQAIPLLGQQQRVLLFLRGFIGALALVCFFYAIAHISLASALTLNLASPVFVTLFAAWWLKEHMRPVEFVMIALALLGAVMIVQPGTALFQWASLVGLFSALLAGVAYTLVRKLSQTENTWSIIFSFAMCSWLIGLPMMWGHFVWPNWQELAGILGVTFFAMMGQVLLTMAYRRERAGPVSSMNYLGVGFATLWGVLVWSEWPNLWAGIGIITLVSSCVGLALAKR